MTDKKIIERFTLNELKQFMLSQGYEISVLMERNEERKKDLLGFEVDGQQCYVYRDDIAGIGDDENITEIWIEVFFETTSNITAEDLNNMSRKPRRGRLSVSPLDGHIAYTHQLSLAGGVTEEHIKIHLKIWEEDLMITQKYVKLVDSSVADLQDKLKDLFNKNG